MSGQPTELKFEEYIENNLLNQGYVSLSKNSLKLYMKIMIE